MKLKVGSKVLIKSYHCIMNEMDLYKNNKLLKSDDIRLGIITEVTSLCIPLASCKNGITYPISCIEEIIEE